MTDNTQPLALMLADRLHHEQPTVLRIDAEHAGEERRRQHARIAELEALLESIAASAGSEPVAVRDAIAHFRLTHWADEDGGLGLADALSKLYGDDDIGRANEELDALADAISEVVTHPSPPEGMVGWWVSVDERLPEPGVPVLLDIGKEYPIRAMWAAKFTLPVDLEDDSGFGEHDGLTDEWYCPEGWYEWNEHEDVHWRVDKTPRAWAPLPPTTSAGSGKGE